MKALACFTESKIFKDLCAKSSNPTEFTRIYLKNKDALKTKMAHRRFCELLCDIIATNKNGDYEYLLKQYKNEKSTVKKLAIRYGQERQIEFSNRLSQNSKNIHATIDIINWNHIEYYTRDGYTEEQARQIIAERQSEYSKIGHDKKRQTEGFYRRANPMCIEYWIDKVDDPQLAHDNHVKNNCLSLENYIRKYGEEEGLSRHNAKSLKKLTTTIERHGVFGFSTQSSRGGREMCLKLYRRFRKMGFIKADMNCQLGDLREFARTDFEFNKSYFYDFCLKPLKIIVEYNGIYFHPRNREDWRRKDLTFDEALAKDLRKISFIEDLGYKVFVIWEDDDIETKINEVINYAKAQLDKR